MVFLLQITTSLDPPWLMILCVENVTTTDSYPLVACQSGGGGGGEGGISAIPPGEETTSERKMRFQEV